MELRGKLLSFFTISFIALGVNLIGMPLFLDSLHLHFGALFVFFTLELLGFRYALLLALTLSVEKIYLYGEFFSSLFGVVELTGVYLLRRFFRFNLIVSGWIFWVFFGWIAYAYLLRVIADLGLELSILLTLKESANGLINITIATIMYLLYQYYVKKEKPISYGEMLFVSVAFTAIAPLFLYSIYQSKLDERRFLRTIRSDMEIISENVRESVVYWLDIHLNAVRELANRLVIWGKENREILQKETEAIRRSFHEFHACYIADEGATALTFYPEVNPKGKYMIGTNFNYRPYYQEVKRTQRYTFTKVFVAKFALKPVVGIAVPAVKEGRFLGYAYCGLRLDRLIRVAKDFSLKEGVYVTFLDREGRVIASSMPGVKPMDRFVRGEIERVEGLFLEVKKKDKIHFNIEKYLNSFFYKESRLRDDIGWLAVLEVSPAPYLSSLFSELSVNFSAMYLFTLISFLIARFVTLMSAEPVRKLSEIMDMLTRTIERHPRIDLPNTNIEEIKKLSDSFEEMAIKAIDYMDSLKKMAYYDPLTELPNRALLNEKIKEAMAFANRMGTKVAILFIDLDYFKTVNDTLGHEIGDRILVQVANRLRSAFRETDTVARFGGDEFVAVVPNVREVHEIIELAERVLRLFDTPFQANEEDIYLSASVGITLYPDNGKSPSELIKSADMAMYRAKEEGKRGFAFFTENMDREAQNILTMKNRLHKALEREEFLLYYQPIYSLGNLELVGLEALLRWKDPEDGIIPPAKFMPVLEELGMIREVGRWVMEKAFYKSREWGERYGVYISVNVSPRQFSDRKFVNSVFELADKTKAQPHHLILEITEASLMKDPEESVNILKSLKAKGFSVAIDDFGTGYSSLSYLRKLPIDIIKIDMTFVQNIVESRVDRAIVESIVRLSRFLGLRTVAEGVEARKQAKILEEIGCDYAQGYLFGRPMPEEEAENLLLKEKAL